MVLKDLGSVEHRLPLSINIDNVARCGDTAYNPNSLGAWSRRISGSTTYIIFQI
jgi:hypothetical protein